MMRRDYSRGVRFVIIAPMRVPQWWRRLRRGRPRPKIFGLGLSRTGTKSLTEALGRLGFDVVHFPLDETTIREFTNGHFDLTLLRDHDGITDITTIPFYQQLDWQYPGSKFILTMRDKEPWLESLRGLLARRPPAEEAERFRKKPEVYRFRRFLRESVYGSNEFDRDRMSRAYDEHHRAVRAYFSGRTDDFLVLDVTSGDGFEKLCPFLGRDLLSERFPWLGAARRD